MEKIKDFFEKSGKINLLLFLCSFGIYFLYFHHIFLNINSTLSSITADSLKNYYTFVFHTKNDPELLNFTGMNYPYGEHIIYTDCQPILTFILRLMPFTYNYLVGIMHSLLFISFIISPLILNKILKNTGIDKFSSFFLSLAISLLSPQFLKINAGHFALAYGCLIPMSILYTLNYLQKRRNKDILVLFIFNTLLFLLHPYLGFCLSVFSFLGLLFFELMYFNKSTFLKNGVFISIAGLVPLLLFKVFMFFTDHHTDRTTEPYGADMMVENIDSILSPVFGPFQPLMEYLFPNRSFHFEGHTYLGFFTILLSFLFLILLPFTFKKIRIRKDLLAIFLSSFIFLLISFGVHLKILNYFNIQSSSVNQFRAVCRFAWIFYFTLPVFIIHILYTSLKANINTERFSKLSFCFALLFFSFNMLEANSFFVLNDSVYWKYRNFFQEDQLNAEEKKVLQTLSKTKPQAILPLPLFHGGSEMYERLGSNNSMIPSMIYSYHSNTPIMSVLMSRTSLTETKNLLQVLNSYKKDKPVEKLFSDKNFFILVTKDPLLPNESRLEKEVKPFAQNDSLKFAFISTKKLLEKKLGPTLYTFRETGHLQSDTNNVIYTAFEDRKAYRGANAMDYEAIYVLDSNRIAPGRYTVSFHYHYTLNTYRGVAVNLIINRSNAVNAEWEYNIPIRLLSGFYTGFSVFEYTVDLKRNNKYEFIMKGSIDQTYKISDFMLRPENEDVLMINQKNDTLLNNFPN